MCRVVSCRCAAAADADAMTNNRFSLSFTHNHRIASHRSTAGKNIIQNLIIRLLLLLHQVTNESKCICHICFHPYRRPDVVISTFRMRLVLQSGIDAAGAAVSRRRRRCHLSPLLHDLYTPVNK